MAVSYYQDSLFGDATFADMANKDGPLIMINTSDLGFGVRFSFVQEYFNLLCSDLGSFPVARAVTASSAVPVVSTPWFENYGGCNGSLPAWLNDAQARVQKNANLDMIWQEDRSYQDKSAHKFAHFVDGGITDPSPMAHSSSMKAAYCRVVVLGTKASSPSAEKSAFSVCSPNTPPSLPPPSDSVWCSISRRKSEPLFLKVVATSPLPSISWRW